MPRNIIFKQPPLAATRIAYTLKSYLLIIHLLIIHMQPPLDHFHAYVKDKI